MLKFAYRESDTSVSITYIFHCKLLPKKNANSIQQYITEQELQIEGLVYGV